mgnify:CR=1 FL=1
MSKSKDRSRNRKARTADTKRQAALPPEPRLVDATTAAWTVTVSTVVLSELGAAGAHFLGLANPGTKMLPVLRDLLLIAAAAVGALSLALLPVVYRLRRVKPPLGFAVFAACAAAAPILTLVVRALRA